MMYVVIRDVFLDVPIRKDITNTMKRFITIGIMLILTTMLLGCVRYVEQTSTIDPHTTNENETEDCVEHARISFSTPVDILEFPSLEAFLNAYLIVRDGASGDINDYVSYFWSSSNESDLFDIAVGAELGTLETLHLPSAIPDDFELGRIRIVGGFVKFHFFHRDDMVSEYTMDDAFAAQRHFAFNFHRVKSREPFRR